VTLITVVALVVAAVFVRWLFRQGGQVIISGPPAKPADQCVAQADGYTGSMTPEQAGNAAIIVGVAIRRGLPARASTIALVTAWQESSLRNLDYGDRDSLGLFQQRPSQGWGTAKQIMNPWYASGRFYDELVKVKNWQTGDINDVAQAVQRSGFPDAYRQHESAGRAWAATLTGHSAAGVTCITNTGPGGGDTELMALLTKVWGDKLTVDQQFSVITINAPDAQTAWSVATMSMAQLAASGIVSVEVGDQYLVTDPLSLADWQYTDPAAALPDTRVVLTLR